ncbi:MAG: hypothetical protein O3C28_08070 [Proteobacteria bacterium]|nr:hypothetical protein [Pseudomonadota bacterium]
MKRKLPPYARDVIAALDDPDTWPNYVGTSADGRNVTLWVAIGTAAWEWADERNSCRHLAVAIPPGTDPDEFNWEFLADHDPVMLCAAGDVGAELPARSARALIRDGVQRVMYLPSDGSRSSRYVAEGVTDAT